MKSIKFLIQLLLRKPYKKLEDLLILAAEKEYDIMLSQSYRKTTVYHCVKIGELRNKYPHLFSEKFFYNIESNILFIKLPKI